MSCCRVLCAVSLSLVCVSVPISAAGSQRLELTDFTLIDGTGAEPRAIERLTVRDGWIIGIDGAGEHGVTESGEVVTTIHLDGAFVIPGLIDAHVHLANYPRPRSELVERLAWALDHGVTTLRDMGGDARILADLRRAIAAGEIAGPELRFAAMFGGETMFDHPAIGQAALGFEPGRAPWLRAVGADADLPRLVARAAGSGVDAIKLYGDLDAARAQAIVEEAKSQGLVAWAHGTVFPASPAELVGAGVDSLSHAPYLVWAGVDEVPSDYNLRTQGPWDQVPPDHPRILELLDAMAERGVVLDATLSMYRDMHRYRPPEGIEWAPVAFEWGVALARLAHERGVPIAVGTDAFFPAGRHAPPNTHVEIETLVENVGLSPMAALVAATQNGAIAAGVGDERGTVEVGRIADLVVLGSDPLADIAATRDIRHVIVGGRVHK